MSAPAIDSKAWAALQARAAAAGLQLLRSEGPGPAVIVVIDAAGQPHRVHRIEDLQDLLQVAGEAQADGALAAVRQARLGGHHTSWLDRVIAGLEQLNAAERTFGADAVYAAFVATAPRRS